MVDKVRYKLFANGLEPLQLKTDPDGWKEDTRKIIREIDKPGIVFDYAGDLTFADDGFDYIMEAERLSGYEAVITCTREKFTYNGKWRLDYAGVIDLPKYARDKNTVKVQMKRGGVAVDLKAIYNDKYELFKSESVDGKDIGELEYQTLRLDGVALDVSSELTATDKQSSNIVSNTQVPYYHTPPLEKVFSGDDDINSVIAFNSWTSGNEPVFSSDLPFLLISETDKIINMELKLDADYIFDINDSQPISLSFGIAINEQRRASNGELKNFFVRYDELYSDSQTKPSGEYTVPVNLDINHVLELKKEQSAIIVMRYTGGNLFSVYSALVRNISVKTNESSERPATIAKGLTLKNLFRRLSLIAFGKDVIRNNGVLDNGDFKDLIVASGLGIRGFEQTIETSFKEALETVQRVFNYDYGIENVNGKEYIAIRKYSDFFKRRTIIDLGQQTDVEYVYTDLHKGISIGYKDGGEYEEKQGLNEFNTTTEFSFNLKRPEQEIEAISDMRADGIGVELARREQYLDNPTEDTPYDKDNFLIDAINGAASGGDSSLYINRKWYQDFEVLPKGVFSPETAMNLRLSPKSNLYRYSNRLGSIQPYPNKKTIFKNALGNSNLETQRKTIQIEGSPDIVFDPIKEREDILNKDLSMPLFKPFIATFKYKFDDDKLDFLLSSDQNGIPNIYNSMSFIDDNGNKHNAYFLEYAPEKEGTLKLILANYGI